MVFRSVYMDRIDSGGQHSRLCEHSPQLPQGFTPVDNITFWPGDKSLLTSLADRHLGQVFIVAYCAPNGLHRISGCCIFSTLRGSASGPAPDSRLCMHRRHTGGHLSL